MLGIVCFFFFFFFQAEDGIRDLVRSRGLGDVYKRQLLALGHRLPDLAALQRKSEWLRDRERYVPLELRGLSLIHI